MGKNSKKKNDVQKVEITTTNDAAYATIVRSMLTAARACKKVGDDKRLRDCLAIADWASAEFKRAII